MTTDLMPMPAGADLVPTLAEERGGITPTAALQRRVEVILDVMANVLEPTKDFGVIPGTDKPTLYKPGAEKLCLTFSFAPADPYIDELGDGVDVIRYRVRVPLVAPNGRVLAVGVGEASTNEEKYRWRRIVCDEEFDETPETLKRQKWARKDGKGYKTKQVRTVPADLANTVLKMAHKRAFIHATLLATGASSVFNQDLEHFNEELAESVVEGDAETRAPRSVRPPQRKSAAPAPAAAAADETAEGVLASCVKAGTHWQITLSSDARPFTARDDKVGHYGQRNVGQRVRLTFTVKPGQKAGVTFYNVSALDVVAVPATPPTSAAAAITADRIPFGDEK